MVADRQWAQSILLLHDLKDVSGYHKLIIAEWLNDWA